MAALPLTSGHSVNIDGIEYKLFNHNKEVVEVTDYGFVRMAPVDIRDGYIEDGYWPKGTNPGHYRVIFQGFVQIVVRWLSIRYKDGTSGYSLYDPGDAVPGVSGISTLHVQLFNKYNMHIYYNTLHVPNGKMPKSGYIPLGSAPGPSTADEIDLFKFFNQPASHTFLQSNIKFL